VDDSEGEHSDGIAEAVAVAEAASAAANEKYSVLMEHSPSCLPAWASVSLEQQSITSFGALQEELAGLSFKLVDWDERTLLAQEKMFKLASQLSLHENASMNAPSPDDRAFHLEAAEQNRVDLECATTLVFSFSMFFSPNPTFVGMLEALLQPVCPCELFCGMSKLLSNSSCGLQKR
jgi:hypothetical protein